MSTSSTVITIEALQHVFAVHGLPKETISYKGAKFICDEFAHFMKENEIKHFRIALCHPTTNGLVEYFIQSI